MSRLHKAARATVVVQFFNIAGMLLSLVAVPLYLRWLGQERYGVLLTGLAFAGYLMFSDAGLSWSSMLLIAQASGRDDRKGVAGIVRNSFSLAACSALLVAIVVATMVWLLASRWHPGSMPSHPEAAGLMTAVGCSVISSLLLSPIYNLFNGLQEAYIAGLYQGIGRILGTVASIVVAASGAPLGLVFGANVLCNFIAGAAAGIHCYSRHRWAFESGRFWDPNQIRQQLRTGAKSFAMQIGGVLSGTAPVLAVSAGAGAEFVPYLSIPLTLLNAPLGMVFSFNANLQAGYGEAIGRNETKWVADTVRRILQHVLVFMGLLSVGFLLLAEPFVHRWTGGRIDIPLPTSVSVWLIAITASLLGVFRFALSGINRHRIAAVSDLLFGALAMVFANAVVRRFGFEWVGVGIFVAAIVTSGWILPRELHRMLAASSLWPEAGFWLRLLPTACVAAFAGWLMLRFAPGDRSWLGITLSAFTCCLIYALGVWRFLPEEWNMVTQVLKKVRSR